MTKRGKNEKFIGLWCTPMEKEDIEMTMKKYGYNSMSSFLRDRIFQNKIVIKKSVKINSRLKEEINKCTMLLRSETNNINQIVKVINTVYEKKKKNGDEVITTEFLEYRLTQIYTIQNRIYQIQEKQIKLLKKALEEKES